MRRRGLFVVRRRPEPRPHARVCYGNRASEADGAMNKAYGVSVTIPSFGGGTPQVQPWVVVATDEQDAALVAVRACCSGASPDAETLRELSPDEIREHDLDLLRHGMARALPTLAL